MVRAGRVARTRVRTRVFVAVAALGATMAVGVAATPASAAPTLEVPVTTVAVGQSLTFTASECPESTDPQVDQILEGALVVGTGTDAVRAGIVDNAGSEDVFQVVPMGWVDPAESAFLSVRCLRAPVNGTATVVHTYPEVAIDVVAPASPVPTLDVAFSRTTAAGGQAIRASGSGCEATAIFEVFAGTDLSFRTTIARNRTAIGYLPVADDGTFDGLIYLNDDDGPLAEGPYVVSTYCDLVPEDRDLARPVLVTVDGTNPSNQIELALDADGVATLSGAGCTGGQLVTAQWVGLVAGGTQDVRQSSSATPSADGSWTLSLGGASWDWLEVTTDCGDPAAGGFHYLDTTADRDVPDPTTTTTTAPTAPPTEVEPLPATAVPATPTYTG